MNYNALYISMLLSKQKFLANLTDYFVFIFPQLFREVRLMKGLNHPNIGEYSRCFWVNVYYTRMSE